MAKNRDEIIEKLKGMADEKYMNFHSSLCPGTNNIMGVRVPKLREYAKKLAKEDWQKNYLFLENEFYEEIMLKGMLLGLGEIDDLNIRLDYLKEFIPQIDNWAVCDITCGGLKFTNNNKESMWNFLQKYLNSKMEFEVRFGIVMLLDYYITDEYVERTLKILDSTECFTYYVRMSVAWAVSIIYIKYREIGEKYLTDNKLDDYTYNATLQKIADSHRIDEDGKKKVRAMRRKIS